MKRVAIYGIVGLYNYGCEAIVRGTVSFIRHLFGEACDITYFSKDYSNDKKITDELGILIENIGEAPTFFSRCISKMVDILQIPVTPFYDSEFKKIIESSDVIMLVGGDIYTIPAYLRNKKKYRYVNYLVEFGNRAIKNGKTIIIYGASIGPFGEYEKAYSYYIRHFEKVNAIICREQISCTYLKDAGVTRNVAMLPDPAFLVEDVKGGASVKKKYIGINLSGLSLRELYGSVSDKILAGLAGILSDIYMRTEIPLMLIPHVMNPIDEWDNDAVFLEKVFEKLPDQVKQVSLFVKPVSFMDAKNYLKQCIIVVSARMHCAINAITVKTPALFLSYSSKALGMAEYVYGNTRWCVALKNIETELADKVEEMLEKTETLQEQILDCRERAIKKYDEYIYKCKEENGWIN